MKRKVYINLPVKDLKASVTFFSALGFSFHNQFTDESAACLELDDNLYVMLLTTEKFSSFTPNKICDASTQNEMIICLTCESREEIHSTIEKAVHAGGTLYSEAQDLEYMYGHGFQDLDGHIWELIFVDDTMAAR